MLIRHGPALDFLRGHLERITAKNEKARRPDVALSRFSARWVVGISFIGSFSTASYHIMCL